MNLRDWNVEAFPQAFAQRNIHEASKIMKVALENGYFFMVLCWDWHIKFLFMNRLARSLSRLCCEIKGY